MNDEQQCEHEYGPGDVVVREYQRMDRPRKTETATCRLCGEVTTQTYPA